MIVKNTKIDDDYIVVKANDNLISVAKSISKAGIPDAVVVDEENKVLGALDDYDIVSKCLAEEKDPKIMTAEDIMYAGPKVKLETELTSVLETMEKLKVTTLPVVDGENKLLGVITNMDVYDGLAQEDKSFFGKLFS